MSRVWATRRRSGEFTNAELAVFFDLQSSSLIQKWDLYVKRRSLRQPPPLSLFYVSIITPSLSPSLYLTLRQSVVRGDTSFLFEAASGRIILTIWYLCLEKIKAGLWEPVRFPRLGIQLGRASRSAFLGINNSRAVILDGGERNYVILMMWVKITHQTGHFSQTMRGWKNTRLGGSDTCNYRVHRRRLNYYLFLK